MRHKGFDAAEASVTKLLGSGRESDIQDILTQISSSVMNQPQSTFKQKVSFID